MSSRDFLWRTSRSKANGFKSQDKQAIAAEVSEVAKGALSAVVAETRGETVNKMTELRKAGRELAYTCVLFVNTLLRRAVEGTPLSA
ncbi:50S ribosomal protein L10 [Escherichia coli]